MDHLALCLNLPEQFTRINLSRQTTAESRASVFTKVHFFHPSSGFVAVSENNFHIFIVVMKRPEPNPKP